MGLVQQPDAGVIVDGKIRYVLMRPDVLMGVARHLPHSDEFFAALEASAFAHAQASFSAYRVSDRFGGEDFLAATCEVAGTLGWGRWRVVDGPGEKAIEVANSPFAEGHGPSARPVCAPIAGVLRAVALVGYDVEVTVKEQLCAAEGHARCCFRLSWPLELAKGGLSSPGER